jgi:hypothetical protein
VKTGWHLLFNSGNKIRVLPLTESKKWRVLHRRAPVNGQARIPSARSTGFPIAYNPAPSPTSASLNKTPVFTSG